MRGYEWGHTAIASAAKRFRIPMRGYKIHEKRGEEVSRNLPMLERTPPKPHGPKPLL